MNRFITTKVKIGLSKVIPDSSFLRYMAYLPKLERFRKNHLRTCPTFENRKELYNYINQNVLDNTPIEYLEFGVYKGETLKHWLDLNTHTESRFYGFDTFTGLPENWDLFGATLGKDTFSTNGALPAVEDARCHFYKGLFQETLPPFLEQYAPQNPLVVHCDADLYSSTMYVLTKAHELLLPGTILIFDEFSCVTHELRALEDYVTSYMRSYEVLGAVASSTRYLNEVAVRLTK